MKVAIIGGGGYLGSTIYQELKKNVGVTVEIFDNGLFSDEYLSTVNYTEMNILHCVADFSHFDKILWCCDIDVQEFYTTEFSKDYINANIKAFEKICKKYKDKMRWVMDDTNTEQPEYQEMLEAKTRAITSNGGITYPVGQLYGPSARIRFDTTLNTMFAMAVMDAVIYVENWLDRIPVQSVALTAKCIAEDILDIAKFKLVDIVYSKIEYAYMMAKVFDDKVQIITSDEMGGKQECYITGDTINTHDDFSIEKSFSYMRSALENGALDSVVKDMYNNSRIIANFMASDKFFKFKSEIIG